MGQMEKLQTSPTEMPGWLEEFVLAQHRACVALMAHLATAGIIPAEDGLFRYLDAVAGTLDEREADLAVPRLRTRDAARLAAVREARDVLRRETATKYFRDAVPHGKKR